MAQGGRQLLLQQLQLLVLPLLHVTLLLWHVRWIARCAVQHLLTRASTQRVQVHRAGVHTAPARRTVAASFGRARRTASIQSLRQAGTHTTNAALSLGEEGCGQ